MVQQKGNPGRMIPEFHSWPHRSPIKMGRFGCKGFILHNVHEKGHTFFFTVQNVDLLFILGKNGNGYPEPENTKPSEEEKEEEEM